MTKINEQIELIVSEIIRATRKSQNLEDLGKANTNGINEITKLVKDLNIPNVSNSVFDFETNFITCKCDSPILFPRNLSDGGYNWCKICSYPLGNY